MRHSRTQIVDDRENQPLNPVAGETPTIGDLVALRLSRRGLLQGAAAAAGLAAVGALPTLARASAGCHNSSSRW